MARAADAGLLAEGQLDALYTPRVPRGFAEGRVRRLFPDARAGEQGLIKRRASVEELFAAETREEFVI